jgi:hypothetical protein
MANSHPSVLAEIADVTGTNDDDGVAAVLAEAFGAASPDVGPADARGRAPVR